MSYRDTAFSSADIIILEIKLLGFKSRRELKFEDNIKHSIFIYPDEMASLNLLVL